MSDRDPGPMSCDVAADVAGLYVLDALAPDEHEQVRAHLAGCPQAHPEFAELGGVVPALSTLVEPVDAPAALKARVMAAIAAEPQAPAARAVQPIFLPAVGRGPRKSATEPEALYGEPARQRWQSVSLWGMAAAAVLVIAVLGAWSMVLQSRADRAEERVALIAQAIEASTDPGSEVAILRGTGEASGASGFAAFPQDGPGYIVLVGLRPAPAGQTYQAWYMVDGTPTSAGLMSVGEDGYAVLSGVSALPGTDAVALTVETAGGAAAPSGDPVVAGELAPSA